MRTWTIARKEIRESLRDRRSLTSGLFYGVWGPLVMGAALIGMAGQHADVGSLTIAATGSARAPSLVAFLASRDIHVEDSTLDLGAAIRDHELPAALIVDEHYSVHFSESRPAKVTVLYDSTRPHSTRVANHLRSALNDYGRTINDTRLVLRGVAPPAINAIRILERDFSTAADRAGRLLATMPIFVLLAAFIGGMSVAADVTAGERERGTLESLLLHPVSSLGITAGKWVAVSVMALATVLLAVAVSFAVLQHPRLQDLDVPIGLTAADAAMMLLILTPLAMGAGAVQLWMAMQTQTFKEAQSKLSMMIFLPMLPGFLFAFGTLQPAPWMAYTPMLGQHLLMTQVVRGDAPPAMTIAVLSAITLATGALAWIAASRQLLQESVLRRSQA